MREYVRLISISRQKTPVDSEQEPSDDNEDEWTYPERKREIIHDALNSWK